MISRNAYVYIALKGYGYCESVRKVFGLIVSYTAVLMFVNVLSKDGSGGAGFRRMVHFLRWLAGTLLQARS